MATRRDWETEGQNKTNTIATVATTTAQTIGTDYPQVGDKVWAAVGYDNQSATTPQLSSLAVSGTGAVGAWTIKNMASAAQAGALAATMVALAWAEVTTAFNGNTVITATLSVNTQAKSIGVIAYSGMATPNAGTSNFTQLSYSSGLDNNIGAACTESATPLSVNSGTLALGHGTTGGSAATNVAVTMVENLAGTAVTTAAPTDGGHAAFGVDNGVTNITATPTGIASAEAFGTPVAVLDVVYAPTSIATAEAFGTPTAATGGAATTAIPDGIATAEAFGTPVAVKTLTATPDGIASSEAFGSVAAVIPVTAAPAGIATGETFGTPTASMGGGGVTVTPTAIGSAEAFGTPAAVIPITAAPAGVASGETFGTPTAVVAAGAVTAIPTGIGSAETFGTPTAVVSGAPVTVTPTGVPTGETFGTPAAAMAVIYAPTGVPTGQAFGSPIAVKTLTVAPVSIASLEAMGAPAAVLGVLVTLPVSIASQEAFGMPTVLVVGSNDGVPVDNPGLSLVANSSLSLTSSTSRLEITS